MFQVNNIRSLFLDYFKNNDHKVVPSSPLIPHNDPSLLFVNSGMVQFKNVFTGEEKRPYVRAASAQKSIRAGGKHNDLDNVGYTARHHTFFEMLGNFSFGDYFKEQAIFYAYDFLTKHFGIDRNRLYVTVYHDDEDAIKLWRRIAGFSDDRIIKISTNDNFWSMGDTGPCGPCSEIFYDHGDKIFGGLPGTKDEHGDRFIEIWNLVFMQFQQHLDGSRTNLPKPSIDTGMGLERVAALLQKLHNNYEIDLFQNIISYAVEIVKVRPEKEHLFSYRIIADHLRSSVFLITDGIIPSNEGRGYVLRRIMRRALRHVYQLGYKGELLHQLVKVLVAEMGEAYPEIKRAEAFTAEIILQEEIKFKRTLENGMKILHQEIGSLKGEKKNSLSGDFAFKLYDTYGFPYDLTVDILKASDLSVAKEEFDRCMKEQKQKARAAWAGSGEDATSGIWFDLYEKFGATEFLGYLQQQAEASILAIIDYKDGHKLIITNQTPFYGESGGQIGDIGTLKGENGKIYQIKGTLKFLGKIHAHICEDVKLKEGDNILLTIDKDYRNKLRANHSATHLLHFALKKILGSHIAQKGSLVTSERLRFDISHPKPISSDEIKQIEYIVNKMIRENNPVLTLVMDLEKAKNSGALALFGEKYEEEVRVVNMHDSVELCGGTHVAATGEIGIFKIIQELGISAGVRRIEAITGEEVLLYLQNLQETTRFLQKTLAVGESEIVDKLEMVLSEKKKLEKELQQIKMQAYLADSSKIDQTERVGNYNLCVKIIEDISPRDFREVIEKIRDSIDNAVIVAFSLFEEKVSLIVALSSDIKDLDAAKLAKASVENIGGTGGGRKDIASAGGFDYEQKDHVINRIKQLITT